jgi:hypothetical protein
VGIEFEGADVVTVDEHRAAVDVVEAGEEERKRGLPGARSTDESHSFARLDRERRVS